MADLLENIQKKKRPAACIHFFYIYASNNAWLLFKRNVRIYVWVSYQIFAYLFSYFSSCDICQNRIFWSAIPQIERVQLVSFLCLCAEQTLRLNDATRFVFTWWNMSPPCRQSARSFSSCSFCGSGVVAVDIEASDLSSALSSSSSLSCGCHFLNTVTYEVLESIAFALLILVCLEIFE